MPAVTCTSNGKSVTASYVLLGGRCNDVTFSTMDATIGPVRVTRLFYSTTLPTTYSRQGIPAGVKLVISYKTPDTNVATYAASIPAGEDVELCYHHEPEADYTSGATFVTEFDRQADTIHAANTAVPVAFIAGMYQYASTGAGYDGSYIPNHQDRNYCDSYLRTAAQIVPASQEPRLTRYRALLYGRGLTWDGFTEYGRGCIPSGGTFDQAVADARVSCINTDAAWVTAQGVRLWSYWFGTGSAGDQWRFTDQPSIDAWHAA